MTCDQDGKCHCGCDIRGDKCNECEFGHHGFPNCTGKLTQTFNQIDQLSQIIFPSQKRVASGQLVVNVQGLERPNVMFLVDVYAIQDTMELCAINAKMAFLRMILDLVKVLFYSFL